MPNLVKIRILGLVTLFVFPVPGYFLAHFVYGLNWMDFFQFESFQIIPIGYGIELGITYGFLAYLFMKAPFFDKVPNKVDHIIEQMPLTYFDGLFLSLCAGIGEELLFRAGLQLWGGPWLTSIVFVALHGYLNPWNWRFSMYGLIVLPFIFLIAFGFIHFGLWFSIAAHFSYDAVLFIFLIQEKKTSLLYQS